MLPLEWAETVTEVVQDAKQGPERHFEQQLICDLFVCPVQYNDGATETEIFDHVAAVMRELAELGVEFNNHPAELAMIHLDQLQLRQIIMLCKALNATAENIEMGTTMALAETVKDSDFTPFTPIFIAKLNRMREAFGLVPLKKTDPRFVYALYCSALSIPKAHQLLHLVTMLRVFRLDAMTFVEALLRDHGLDWSKKADETKASLVSEFLLDYLRVKQPDQTNLNLILEMFTNLGWPARAELTDTANQWLTEILEMCDVCAAGDTEALQEVQWVIEHLVPEIGENPRVKANLARMRTTATPRTE